MNMKNHSENSNQREINVKEIISILNTGRSRILKIVISSSLIALITSLILVNFYTSETLLYVKNQSKTPNVLSQYAGLASMAGISLPGSGGGDKALEIIEMIKSRAFLKHLLTFEEILPALIAAKSYDKSTGKINFDRSLYDPIKNNWVDEEGANKPSYLEAYKKYLEVILVSHDKLSGFISIKVEHVSPLFAKEFLELVIKEANTLMRERDLEQSSMAIDYLKTELAKTSYVEIKSSINSLIEAQLETQMMARLNNDYILGTIEPPFIPEEKSRPSRALICILGFVFGIVVSISSLFLENYVRSLRD